MAVPIITSYSDFTLYTSQLQRLDVEVDTEQVELKIFHQARIYYSGDGHTEIFLVHLFRQKLTTHHL